MMAIDKRLSALDTLSRKLGSLQDVVDFLLFEEIMTKLEYKEYNSVPDKVRFIFDKLNEYRDAGKFQLLEYEWQILPVERIKLTVVTDKSNKEFSWNA